MAPAWKLSPEIVTNVPPVVRPCAGLMPVRTGGKRPPPTKTVTLAEAVRPSESVTVTVKVVVALGVAVGLGILGLETSGDHI
jgi:hypothetical protein